MSAPAEVRSSRGLDRATAIAIDHAAVGIATTWYTSGPDPRYAGISIGDMVAYDLVPWLIARLKGAVTGSAIEPGSPMTSAVARVRAPLSRRVAAKGFDATHATINRLAAARHRLGPGFHRPAGIRTVFFDPYVGYQALLPDVFGNAYERALVPRPNIRRLPEIRGLQRLFGARAEYGGPLPTDPDRGEVARALQALDASLARFASRPAPDLPGLASSWPGILAEFAERVRELLPAACAHVASAQAFVAEERVDAVVLPYDEFGIYKALALVARREGLFGVRYQHGVANGFPAFVPPTSEKVLVYDDVAEALYRRLGVSRQRLGRVAHPMRPVLEARRDAGNQGAARAANGLPNGKPIVLFAETPFCGLSALEEREDHDDVIRDIARAVRAVDGAVLVVKLHPNSAGTDAPTRIGALLTRELGANGVVLTSNDIRDLVIASDVVVGELSTVLWEATVLSRPAIGYTARAFVREVFAHDRNSGVTSASDVESLAAALRDALASRTAATGTAAGDGERVSVPRPEYFSDPRWEVVSLVPPTARRVLDVGCGAGWIGSHVKRARPAWVAGIEYDPSAADVARGRLDRVDVADLDQYDPPFEPASFDCLIFADVLEHLRDPQAVLRRFVSLLTPDGTVVLSLPNIAHYTTTLGLLRNRWDYADEGLLDRTHLRFFTRSGVEDLVRQAGLRPVRMVANTAAGRIMRSLVAMSGGRLHDMIVFQHLVVARRESPSST